MPELKDFLDEIDSARIRRVKELSEVKRIFSQPRETDPLGVQSKAVVVLSYASWEGFYNECVATYHKFLLQCGLKVKDAGWLMLVGALSGEFESLRQRNHSAEAKKSFVENLQSSLACDFTNFDSNVIKARSNLDFDRISENFSILGFPLTSIQRFRNKIDKELVGWRHGVAHGDSPDLTEVDVSKHIDFVANMLALISDHFQAAMLDHLPTELA